MAEGGTLRVGLFGIGLEAYWSQFDGLEKRLKGYVTRVAKRLAGPGREIGVGHVGDTLDKLGRLLGIEVMRVC